MEKNNCKCKNKCKKKSKSIPIVKDAVKLTKAFLRSNNDAVINLVPDNVILTLPGDTSGLIVANGSYFGKGVPSPAPGGTPGVAQFLERFQSQFTLVPPGEILDVFVNCELSGVIVLTQSTGTVFNDDHTSSLVFTDIFYYYYQYDSTRVLQTIFIFSNYTTIAPFLALSRAGESTECLLSTTQPANNQINRIISSQGKKVVKCKTCQNIRTDISQRQIDLFVSLLFQQQIEAFPDQTVLILAGLQPFIPFSGTFIGKPGLAEVLFLFSQIATPLPNQPFGFRGETFYSIYGPDIIVQEFATILVNCLGGTQPGNVFVPNNAFFRFIFDDNNELTRIYVDFSTLAFNAFNVSECGVNCSS